MADFLSRALLVAKLGPVLEIVKAAIINVIWVPIDKRPGVLLRSHQNSTGHLTEDIFKIWENGYIKVV